MTPAIGTSTSRVDGRDKVTGHAKYAAEFSAPDLAHGAVVSSTITKGRIARIDASRALAVPGVLDVVTHANRPDMGSTDKAYHDDVAPEGGSPFRPLYDDRIRFNGQPIALVLAEDFETAFFAATLVTIEYEKDSFATDLETRREQAHVVEKPQKPRGDAAKALAKAAVRHEAEYVIAREYHNPMELFATTVVRDGSGKLTIYDKTQGVQNVQRYVCGVFSLKPDDVRVISPYVGGAFGSGLRPQYQVVLATLGALMLKRSVRLMLTRAEMYGLNYRPETIERIALGANSGGMLDAISYEAIAETSQYEEFSRIDAGWAEQLYASTNARYAHKLVSLDVATPGDMRAPGAATGVYALECAMDELAVALKLDPVDLRLRCYSDHDQVSGLPYSSKALKACYQQGAEAFGWTKRSAEPRSMREGHELVGWGMASGVWEALQMPFSTKIVMTANGHVEVSSAASDIGTGTYTIMAQVAAEMLGVPVDSVTVKLADSTLPTAQVEGGSWTAASVAHAIVNASEDIKAELLAIAQEMPGSPLKGAKPDDVVLAEGGLVDKNGKSSAVAVADIMRHGRLERVEKERSSDFEEDDEHAHNTHSAIFAEVRID
ncbi:MAG TPA: xanthine dehydrogenase family protein molybdopterin-binding subunit, partial [Bradyrhizobium sp.]